MWQDYERDAWLGPALEQMSGEQLEAFDDAAGRFLTATQPPRTTLMRQPRR